jgi:hypothetical protein
MKWVRVLAAVGVAWALAGALAVAMFMGLGAQPAHGLGEPLPGGRPVVATYTLVDARALVTETVYSASPQTVGAGLDVSRVADWHAADIFVTADVSGTATLTATVQFSPDQVVWADAETLYVTWNQTGTATLNTMTYRTVQTADGTTLLRVPVAGEFMRVMMVAGGAVTATVQATLRNN